MKIFFPGWDLGAGNRQALKIKIFPQARRFFHNLPYLRHSSMTTAQLNFISTNPATGLGSAVITTTITTR
jgi:hypothetical protein